MGYCTIGLLPGMLARWGDGNYQAMFDWRQLEQYICNLLGNSNCESQYHYDYRGWRRTNEVNALTSCRLVDSPLGGNCGSSEHTRWDSHGTHHGFDQLGFSARPGGTRWPTGGLFFRLGTTGLWWSSPERSYSALYKEMFYCKPLDCNS